VFWPAAIALGLLVFLGAIGSTGIGTARADNNNDRGDYCKILGPSTILVGGHYLYMAVVDGTTWRDDHEASIDNISGNSKITSAVIADEDRGRRHDGIGSISETNYGSYYHHNDVAYDTTIGPANVVDNLTDYSPLALDDQVRDDLMAQFAPDGTPGTGFDILQNLNNCGLGTANALARIYNDAILDGSVCAIVTSGATAGGANSAVNSCLIFGTTDTFIGSSGTGVTDFSGSDQLYDDGDIDCPTGATCTIAGAIITAAVAAVQADIANPDYSCRDIATDAGKAAVGAGASELVGLQFYDFTKDLCQHDWKPFDHDNQNFIDDVVIVDVTCTQAGNFDITFTNEDRTAEAISQSVRCLGAPSSNSTVTASPASIEIVPAVGNVSNSFINVNLLDSAGPQAGPADVDFITDRCSVETSSVDTVAEWNAIAPLFGAFNTSVPTTAAAIQASPAGTTQPDSTRGQDSMVAVPITSGTTNSTRAGAILMCDPQAAPGATPGVATVTVVIDSSANGVVAGTANDIVLTVKVTVVGPPASITVAASPTSVRCGEKATITATVKDAIGQNVSEHTRVEAVTNAGGTLAGTGAVANQAGLVSPISSTVSETFSGVATFFLLTSEQHTGPYEVVVTSGGQGALGAALGGVFSTPPVSAQTTVTCSLPAAPVAPSTAAPAPTVSAPRTGSGGITAPNTGDAGLVGRDSGRNWTEFAAFGALAAVSLAGAVVFRKRNND
jgi:hypothetical protein